MRLKDDFLRHVPSWFKMGALALLPLIVLVVAFVSVWNMATDLGFKFLENRFLNFLINCSIVSTALCFIGWILEKPMFRGVFDSLFATLPIVSWFHKFIPSSDQLEKFKSGSYAEARVEIYDGIFVRGILVREWTERGVSWCRVLVPTTPVPMTGNLIEVEKSKVVITRRSAEDLFRTYLSLGMK